jgi:hypothetical protein
MQINGLLTVQLLYYMVPAGLSIWIEALEGKFFPALLLV